jgi:hypothetical protein
MDDKVTKPNPLTETELALMALQLNQAMMRADLDLIHEYMQKLDEVYYHVFPERLAQDVKFGQQLADLMKRSRRPDTDEKQ